MLTTTKRKVESFNGTKSNAVSENSFTHRTYLNETTTTTTPLSIESMSNYVDLSIKIRDNDNKLEYLTITNNNINNDEKRHNSDTSSIFFDSSRGYLTINSNISLSTQKLNMKLLNLLLNKLKENNQLRLNENNMLSGQFYADSNLLNSLLENTKPVENTEFPQVDDLISQASSSNFNSSHAEHQEDLNSRHEIHYSIENNNIIVSTTDLMDYEKQQEQPLASNIDYSILTADLLDIVDLPSDICDNNGNKCEEICCLLKSLDRNNIF